MSEKVKTKLQVMKFGGTSVGDASCIARAAQIVAEGRRLFDGTALLRELTPRALDTISSLGERLCAPIFAASLSELGVRGLAFEDTELILTDSYHGGAEPLMDATRERCEAR